MWQLAECWFFTDKYPKAEDCYDELVKKYANTRYLDSYLAMLKDVMLATAGVRRPGSAALDLAYVAAGRTDGFFEIGLGPWDTAAGSLLVEEAGGRVGTLSGGEYTQGGNIIAASPRVYEGLVSLVAPHLTDSLREG